MRKCLIKYRPHNTNFIWSEFDLQLKTYIYRINELFKDLQCSLHDHDSIIAICIDSNCEEVQHILCLKCIISDHQHESQNILVIQEIVNKREKLFRLIQYLHNKENSDHQSNLHEYTWLQDCILNGKQIPYPSLTFDNVFLTVQDAFLTNMDDLKSQVEKSVHSLQCNSQKYKKIQQFKQRMDHLIKTTHSQIYLNFQSILYNETQEQKSTDAKSMPQAAFLNLSQIDQNVEQMDKDSFENIHIIENNLINTSFNDTTIISPLMPVVQFLDKTNKRSFLGKPKVKFEEGGKIVTMQKNTVIISQELYCQDNIEIRIRILSFLSGCLHFGFIERTTYELTKNIDNVGIWACLDSQSSSDHSRLGKVQEFCLQIDSIVGLNLNFVDDVVSLRLFTRDGILILFQKKGCLMKQKQYVYISCLEGQTKLEVLN
ncbi:unnamed protein product (macronuclear) [Paramecium tetraurelia]|uniref:Uncharacterized protein n=1 Tax=Paramecium tetraurelia TaxID=5888 RepID=A0DKZ9_PARTE|nr:uncharacterized protein GSPATT00018033001 [Paramecium tetraurelia]CAK83716.1 unnamed protein product [Paramecium tetraurelia]|eukprot:XP_001451113.1 hypothetical protein (macronuclear) [Paramecium tetraurelia strain d4-2]